MKKIKVLFAAATILFVSCQKEKELNPIPQIKKETISNVPAPAPITNIIPNNILTTTTSSGVETVTYTNGMVAKFTSVLGKINVSVTKGGKTDVITGTDITFSGIRTVKLYTGGKLYHSFSINSAGKLSSIFIDERYYPFANTLPTGGARYVTCMKGYINLCASSFWCTLGFGSTIFGVASAGIGWSVGCLLGIHV